MRYIFHKKIHVFFIFLLDLIGGIVFLPFRIFKNKKPGNVAKILVIRLDSMDDVIFSTVVAPNLKSHYKGSKVTFLTSNLAIDTVIDNPYIDEVICYDAPWFSRKGKRIFEFKRFFKLADEIKRHDYDLGLDLVGDFRHIVLMALAGVRFRIGYGVTGGGYLLHRQVEYNQDSHPIERNLDTLRGLPLKIACSRPCVYTSREAEKQADEFLKRNKIASEDFLIIINPVAGCHAQRWPDERFASLMDILSKDYNARIVLIGTEIDKDQNDRMIDSSETGAINAAGIIPFNVITAIIKRSRLFIGVDSVLSHIAILENRPSIILRSAVDTKNDWQDIGGSSIVIQRDISCKGCNRPDCRHNICMDLISVYDVMDAVDNVLVENKKAV
jgi:ADP-heptose:LPS heptosyltransferase